MKVGFFASLDCGGFVKDTASWYQLFSKIEPEFTREAELNFPPERKSLILSTSYNNNSKRPEDALAEKHPSLTH